MARSAPRKAAARKGWLGEGAGKTARARKAAAKKVAVKKAAGEGSGEDRGQACSR